MDYFAEAMGRLREKFLIVPLEAVSHPASAPARQAAEAQQAAASAAPAVGQEELTAQKEREGRSRVDGRGQRAAKRETPQSRFREVLERVNALVFDGISRPHRSQPPPNVRIALTKAKIARRASIILISIAVLSPIALIASPWLPVEIMYQTRVILRTLLLAYLIIAGSAFFASKPISLFDVDGLGPWQDEPNVIAASSRLYSLVFNSFVVETTTFFVACALFVMQGIYAWV